MKFAEGVTPQQLKLARVFQRAGLCTYTQAVKAFQQHRQNQISQWKRDLADAQAKQSSGDSHQESAP